MSDTITLPINEFRKLKEMISIPKYKYEEMEETIEILTDSEIQKEIEESKKEIKEGKFVTLTQLKNEV